MKFKTNILLPIVASPVLLSTALMPSTSCSSKPNEQQSFLSINNNGIVTGFNPEYSNEQILEHISDNTLVFPKEVRGIADHAFWDASKGGSKLDGLDIKHIKFEPQSMCLSIGSQAFKYAKDLETIELPPTLWSYGLESFKLCSKLKSVTYSGVPLFPIVYGSSCFSGCSFEQFDFPEKTLSIGKSAFEGCSNLQKIRFPESLDFILNNAFYRCKSLSEIDISSSHPQPDYVPHFPEYSDAFAGVSENGKIIYDSNTQCEYSPSTGEPLHDHLHTKWWEYFTISSNHRIIEKEGKWHAEAKK